MTFTNQIQAQAQKEKEKEREKHMESLRHQFYQYYGHKWWKRGVEHKIPPVPENNIDDNWQECSCCIFKLCINFFWQIILNSIISVCTIAQLNLILYFLGIIWIC